MLASEMRRPTTPRFGTARVVLALLCLACTGVFTAARGVVARADALSGPGWMAATQDQHLVAARTSEALGLLRADRRADTGAEGRRFGFGGPPHAGTRLVLAAGALAPRAEVSRTIARPSSLNRAPYDATAPPALP